MTCRRFSLLIRLEAWSALDCTPDRLEVSSGDVTADGGAYLRDSFRFPLGCARVRECGKIHNNGSSTASSLLYYLVTF